MNALLRTRCQHAWSAPSRQTLRLVVSSNASRLPWHARPEPSASALRSYAAVPSAPDRVAVRQDAIADALPWSCPGCGAYRQPADPKEPGYFSLNRKPVREYVLARSGSQQDGSLDDVPVADLDGEEAAVSSVAPAVPVCDRCHDLLHHNRGVSVEHPTIDAVQAIFDETPYRYNHVYQVIDAADFPMSLIPRLHEKLDLSPQRSQNRRSKHAKFLHGRVAEMSFIITRSDLLAPKKELVDSLMPTLLDILRKAIGRDGKNVRLGNVHCVSAHRGWWTKEVKENIWARGGGGWMVGKANVGKSNLIESILPKARLQAPNPTVRGRDTADPNVDYDGQPHGEYLDTGAGLLPPKPPDTKYPVLPVVSHLPGTTAAPIRIPFGDGKGELFDLPGLARGGLEDLVEDKHRESLVMRNRVRAEQVTIKPWQSLVISNLVCITPKTDDLVFLASPFLNLEYHVTHTDKAKEILAQQRNHVLTGIAKPEVAETIASAGSFRLSTDVTRQRAGPLTARDAAGLDPKRLHFAVFATDILIESVGWIEIAAQVRRRDLEADENRPGFEDGDQYPEIEVFSPNGVHIGQRQTLNAWLMGGKRKLPVSRRKARPRMSMKGQKKAMKKEKREREAGQLKAKTDE